jgi:hypothetical protein
MPGERRLSTDNSRWYRQIGFPKVWCSLRHLRRARKSS